jgi:hypothetical protein
MIFASDLRSILFTAESRSMIFAAESHSMIFAAESRSMIFRPNRSSYLDLNLTMLSQDAVDHVGNSDRTNWLIVSVAVRVAAVAAARPAQTIHAPG